jgi:hypothetical protein
MYLLYQGRASDLKAPLAPNRLLHLRENSNATGIECSLVTVGQISPLGVHDAVDIGRLMARNNNWANLRLQRAEALSDELQVDLRIGLVLATTARELCR